MAIAPADNEATAITRWEALALDIASASELAQDKKFNYQDPWENKEARSWVAELRRLKGRIERARKDAKSVHLERGRAVDETAKTLEAAVQGLIAPHEAELNAIKEKEQARIDAHRAVLARIDQITEGITTSAEAEARLKELESIDPTTLEEFAASGANRKIDAAEQLAVIIDRLREQEAERAELEALRAEKAAREEAERQERIRQAAIAEERERQERDRRLAEAAAAQREAQALAAAAAAQKAREEAERRAAEAEARERAMREQAAIEAEIEKSKSQQTFQLELTDDQLLGFLKVALPCHCPWEYNRELEAMRSAIEADRELRGGNFASVEGNPCAELIQAIFDYSEDSNLLGIVDDIKANNPDLLIRAKAMLGVNHKICWIR